MINAGSSSIKFSVFPAHESPRRQGIICEGECEGIGHRVHFTARDSTGASLVDAYLAEGASHEDALAALLRWLERTGAVLAIRHAPLDVRPRPVGGLESGFVAFFGAVSLSG